jgi:hypothetical protein
MPIAKQFDSVAQFAEFVAQKAEQTPRTKPEEVIADAIRQLTARARVELEARTADGEV